MNFNPRPRAEGGAAARGTAILPTNFNPRPRAEGGGHPPLHQENGLISTHALVQRAADWCQFDLVWLEFQPTPSCRGRRRNRCGMPS